MLLWVVLVACVSCSVCVQALTQGEVEVSFKAFISKFNKNYDATSYDERLQIFTKNVEYIESFNSNNSQMKLGINKLSDLSPEEYQDRLQAPFNPPSSAPVTQKILPGLPISLDWRNLSVVGPVLDMLPCLGPSYAVVGCVQSSCAISSGSFQFYDPTQVVKCDATACNGTEAQLFTYVEQKGLHSSWDNCDVNPGMAGCCINDHLCYAGNELGLQTAVGYIGPIVVMIDGSHQSFQSYKTGIYSEQACSSSNLNLNLLVVGYGVQDGQDFWIAQNFWGESWGMSGYIWMARNQNNNCGIASYQCHAIGTHQCTRG